MERQLILLWKKINLKTEKRELVGVFGKTGAGKSSLINAVIGEKNLLPCGSISACTSVIIKVEANMQSKKYEAHIEFITEEEWKDELWSLKNFHGNNADQEKDDDQDYQDTVEKLSALYGEEEWEEKTTDDLMDRKHFKEIPEFLQSQTKILTFKSAEDLSKECVKYLRSASKGREGGEIKRCYWPLVKCVTIKVPDNDLLQHVTLVDLPGNGDYNKSRDEMWKEVVGGCSTVWIVTEINRAASEKEAWEILETVSSLIGNGGECQQIHFICTKSDIIGGSNNHSAGVCDQILERNKQAKEEVRKKFNQQSKLRDLFKIESLQVFTVSSTEFLEEKHLNSEQTEIPKLQRFLQNLNDSHSKTETSNYVSGAYGILSLIQGARCTEVAGEKTDVCRDLEENEDNLKTELKKNIRECKKRVYSSLTMKIERAMLECYEKAAEFTGGEGSLDKMRETIVKHVRESKDIMFEQAKDEMLRQLRGLEFLFLVMDEFVRNKLTEWGLSYWIDRFEEQGIDEESLYCLKDEHIDKLFSTVVHKAKFKKKLESLKSQKAHGETADSTLVCPSTSDTRDKEEKEENILSVVEKIMRRVNAKIPDQDNMLNKFLKKKINLKTDKRELVGVFGKTGAGKSSLINAIIGEKNLLPCGSISACTSVMIKVEANMQSEKYEAHIEFITEEEWNQELRSFEDFCRDNADLEKEDDQDYQDKAEKLSALYGEEWEKNDDLMDGKNFKEIPEFLQSQTKILTFKSAEDLSKECVKYLRSSSEGREGGEIKRCYWPLVKCVTIKVPDNDLLQHVTLVDLPGNGDYNKSRDEMWKEVIGGCSTVWIVTEINRAASETEAWEILKSASSIIGNGGECQQIHFICTKSDLIGGSNDLTSDDRILERNKQAKEKVKEKFNKQNKLKKLFKDDSFKVFTVSSEEFLKKTHLNAEQTEIPELQKFLQNLNDSHSKTETSNYVSGAYGILSLIQGASCSEVPGEKTGVSKDLEENLRCELGKVRKPMEEAYETFEKCLSDGVEKAKKLCEKVVKSVIHPKDVSGSSFHKILKCLVINNGTHKPKNGKQINLNMKLASFLTDSIDEEFQKTFP
ncbi:hypothetical protein L3Q82_002755 [Scortum barcoo]|uniref:Uncharacterized protein n=1 Tax=Scortum barcoo TaxID=214431 RepID=A0ACB8VUR4_9TELE|nr:hypothetical protein L3Q82_002755 [Scortum barcoo]